MAWQAQLTSIGTQADKVVMVFAYYDDAIVDGGGQPKVQWVENFVFDPSWTNSQMQQAVQARGQTFRAAKVRADVLAGQFPLNTSIIAIP
jgi:hypothetical protein